MSDNNLSENDNDFSEDHAFWDYDQFISDQVASPRALDSSSKAQQQLLIPFDIVHLSLHPRNAHEKTFHWVLALAPDSDSTRQHVEPRVSFPSFVVQKSTGNDFTIMCQKRTEACDLSCLARWRLALLTQQFIAIDSPRIHVSTNCHRLKIHTDRQQLHNKMFSFRLSFYTTTVKHRSA